MQCAGTLASSFLQSVSVWDVAIAFVALHCLTVAKDLPTRAMIGLAAACLAYALHGVRPGTTSDVVAGPLLLPGAAADPPQPIVSADLYPLRADVVPPGAGLRHLARRPELARAIRRLASYSLRDRGMVSRVGVALEDFFARIDRLGRLPPSTASPAARDAAATAVARNVQVLRDLRAEALNAMATLEWTQPARLAGAVRRASRVAQRETSAALQALVEAHAWSPVVQAAEWRAPYAADHARDPGHHLW